MGCWGAGELPGLLGGLSHVAVRGGEEVVAQGLAGGARNPEVVGQARTGSTALDVGSCSNWPEQHCRSVHAKEIMCVWCTSSAMRTVCPLHQCTITPCTLLCIRPLHTNPPCSAVVNGIRRLGQRQKAGGARGEAGEAIALRCGQRAAAAAAVTAAACGRGGARHGGGGVTGAGGGYVVVGAVHVHGVPLLGGAGGGGGGGACGPGGRGAW